MSDEINLPDEPMNISLTFDGLDDAGGFAVLDVLREAAKSARLNLSDLESDGEILLTTNDGIYEVH